MAEERIIELSVDATQADKALKKFGGTLEDVYGEGVQPLNFAIGELEDRLYEMAAAGQQNTQEFKEMAKEVGRMKKTIIDTDMAVDAMAQNMSQNVGGALQGIAGGFTLAQGAMGAFGADGEAVQEVLLRVQSAMAISDGIQSIREGISAFKAMKQAIMANTVVQKVLNVVMSLNPVGLIIAAVVALGAAIYALWDPIKRLLQFLGLMAEDVETAEEANERLTKSIDRQRKAIEKLQAASKKAHDNRMRELKLRDASEEEIHQATLDRLKEEEGERKQNIKVLSKNIKDRAKLYKKALREEDFETAKSLREANEKDRKAKDELLLNHKEYSLAKQEEDKRYQQFLDDQAKEQADKEKQEYKERLDRWKEFQQNKLDALREIENLQTNLIKDEDRKRLEELRLGYERQIADYKKNTKDKEQLEQLLSLALETYNRDRNAILNQIEVENEAEMMPIREAVTQKKLELVESEFMKEQEVSDARKRLSKQDLENARTVAEAKLQMSSDTLGAINDLVQAFAGEDERSARKAFNVNKAVGIAQAVISTAQGIMAQLAVPQDALTGANFVKAGIVASTGAAQIATIAKSKFNSSVSGGSVVPSVPTASAAPPQFNVVGDTGVNQLAQTLGQNQGQPVKAYVVGQEVTTQQSLDRSIQNTASL